MFYLMLSECSQEITVMKLKVEHLLKSYNNKKVVDDVSFELEKGEFISLLGPSGSGKSTILKLLIGLEKPDYGKVYKDGLDITDFPVSKRSMGIVFQNYALFDNMTVLSNVLYATKFKKDRSKIEYKQRAISILTDFGLNEHLNKKPNQLSFGERQRVAIARTLILSPQILLLDEITSALDEEKKIFLRSWLRSIAIKYDFTSVMVTHDMEEALSICDKILILKEGKVQMCASVRDVIDRPSCDFVRNFVYSNLNKKYNSLKTILNL